MVWLQTSVDTNASQLSTFRPNVTHRIQSPPDVAVLLGVESQSSLERLGLAWLVTRVHGIASSMNGYPTAFSSDG